jgi:hypothetical protein
LKSEAVNPRADTTMAKRPKNNNGP